MLHILHSVTDHLKIILNQKRISLLDSSCGDMYWMPEFLNNRSDVDFTGYDITDSNIDNHKKNFREFTRQKYILNNISKLAMFITFSVTLQPVLNFHT